MLIKKNKGLLYILIALLLSSSVVFAKKTRTCYAKVTTKVQLIPEGPGNMAKMVDIASKTQDVKASKKGTSKKARNNARDRLLQCFSRVASSKSVWEKTKTSCASEVKTWKDSVKSKFDLIKKENASTIKQHSGDYSFFVRNTIKDSGGGKHCRASKEYSFKVSK